jgi:hypothetical protein
MAQTPSQRGLAQAAAPIIPGAPTASAAQETADLTHQGTTDLYNPQWGRFFDMLNAAAPGGITAKAGLPGQATEPAFGGVSDPYSPTYNPAIDPRLHPDLVANAKIAAKVK